MKTAMWHVLQEKLAVSLYAHEPIRETTAQQNADLSKPLTFHIYTLNWTECNQVQKSTYLARAAVALEVLGRVTMIEAVGGSA